MSNLQVSNARIDSMNSTSIESYDATIASIKVETIKPRFNHEKMTISFARDSFKSVDIAQAGISDADFIAILRSKIKVLVDADDELYIRALARMVVS